eukprot:Lankesteria_metandrocarpae@DN1392_c0_g1_i1.p1
MSQGSLSFYSSMIPSSANRSLMRCTTVMIILFITISSTVHGQDFTDSDWYGQSALAGMVRCHKCLFSDDEIRNGDMAFLMRSADSHQRLLTPLELATNSGNLPGRMNAELFYNSSEAALKYAQVQLHTQLQQQLQSSATVTNAVAAGGAAAAGGGAGGGGAGGGGAGGG